MESYSKNGFNGEKSNQEVVFDDLKNSNLERISIKSVSIDSTVDRDSLKGALIKSESEKKLVWKINYTLLPFIGAIIFIQFIDKFTLSVAAILGLINDTSLTGTQYSWLGSFFYLGFVCFQIPSNYLLQKFKISRYLGVLLIMWGIVMCCTALCKNFTQLAVTRVLLGLFEAGTYPSLIIIINTIYRRSEQSAAYGYLWLSNGTGTMIGSACAYGISYINNAKGISSWKWPYIIWGSLTILFGIICFFFLPDNPYSFMFRLTEEEEKIVQKRTQDNAVVRVYEIKKWHIWEALREPRLWLICFAAFFNNLHTSGLVIFSTLIVQGLGFSASNTILMLIPGGFMAALFCILAAYISRKTGQLYPGAAVCTTISLVGVVLLAVLPMAGIKLLGYFLAWGGTGTSVILLTIVSSNVNGYTKKIFYNGMNMIFFTLGSFIGPLLMLERESPRYITGMTVYCIGNVCVLISLLAVRQLMALENKKRLNCSTDEKCNIRADLTDQENKSFIYKL